MAGVSDIGHIISQKYLLASLRSKLNENQRATTTGKISASNAGLGTTGVANAIDFRNRTNSLQAYTSNIESARTRFKVMDAAIGVITDDVRKVTTTLRAQLQGTEPKATIIADEARTMLNNMVAKMNEQVGGKHVFSGDQIYEAPFTDMAALNASMSGLVAGWLTGTTANDVVNDARGVSGAGLGLNGVLPAAGDVVIRVADQQDINTGIKGDQQGFQDALRGLAIIANLPQPTTALEQENYWNIVNGAIELLEKGAVELDTVQGLLGNRARIADDLLVEHEAAENTYAEFIGSIEDVDAAEAAVNFQNLKLQLEASYSILTAVKDLSLVNYL